MRSVCLLAAVGLLAGAAGADAAVPILYTTDLLHPHADPDDHFDIATLFGMPEFDIRGVVFDLGPIGRTVRGRAAAADDAPDRERRAVRYGTARMPGLAG